MKNIWINSDDATVSTSEATVATGGASESTTGTASDDSTETLTVTQPITAKLL
ncbi:hypothetical protein [Rothia nasimurium]|uniref:hypothetical protein n=1 Tax=Rothia nasimurium TaxID=85336 RepID=UPI0015D77D3E|nr:hypothetical protein [Rothia nasimurium]